MTSVSKFFSEPNSAPAAHYRKAMAPASHLAGGGVFVHQSSASEREVSGIHSVQHVKRVDIEHKIIDPQEKMALERVRYHSGAWEKVASNPHFGTSSALLASDAVRESISGEPSKTHVRWTSDLVEPVSDATGHLLPPSPGRRRLGRVDAVDQGGCKARQHRSEIDHVHVGDGALTAVDGPYGSAPVSPLRSRTMALQQGAGAARALTGYTVPAYEGGRTSSKAVGDRRDHLYTEHLSGSGVSSLMVDLAPPVPECVGTKVMVPVSHPPLSPGAAEMTAARGRAQERDNNYVHRPRTAAVALAAASSGSAVAAAIRPSTSNAGGQGDRDSFLSVARVSFTGVSQGGPRERTPPRRRLIAVTSGTNDLYRKTSIY